jgi:hypothetical protein
MGWKRFHGVTKDQTCSYDDIGLGLKVCLFQNASAKASGKDYGFHGELDLLKLEIWACEAACFTRAK